MYLNYTLLCVIPLPPPVQRTATQEQFQEIISAIHCVTLSTLQLNY